MKKIFLLLTVLIFAVSSSCFAAALAVNTITPTSGLQVYGGVDATDAGGTTSVLLGKMSKGVNFRCNYSTIGYAAATKHGNGTKAYGSAYDSTAIFFQDVGLTGTIPDLSSVGNGSFGAAWTAM
jgi:hypothetical protein